MESNTITELDKYIHNPLKLPNSYDEIKGLINTEGFLENLARTLVTGEARSLKFKKVYFYGKYTVSLNSYI